MVQNPHHYPWRHAPSLASCSLTGVTLPPWRHTLSLVQGCPAGADKRQKGVAGNDGGVTADQLHDGACVR